MAAPEGKAKLITASVPEGLVERLDALAGSEGWGAIQGRHRGHADAATAQEALSGERGLRSQAAHTDPQRQLIRLLRRQDAGRSPRVESAGQIC